MKAVEQPLGTEGAHQKVCPLGLGEGFGGTQATSLPSLSKFCSRRPERWADHGANGSQSTSHTLNTSQYELLAEERG